MSNRRRRRGEDGRRLTDEQWQLLQQLAGRSGLTDPRRLGGAIAGPGGPNDHGMVVTDMTDCVLLDDLYVCTVDTVRDKTMGGQAIFMVLSGRINKTVDRAQVGFAFGPDGAAALITELLALATRGDAELLDDVTRRLTRMYQDKTVDLPWLRAAIDNVLDDPDNIADPP